jgi:hypothetical protein
MIINEFSIDKSFLSNQQYLHVKNQSFSWSKSPAELNFRGNDSSLDNLFKLNCLEIDIFRLIPLKYVKMLNELNVKKDDNFEWRHLLSDKDQKIFLKILVENIEKNIAKIKKKNLEYFFSFYPKRQQLLSSMCQYQIDYNNLKIHLDNDANPSNYAILKSFDNDIRNVEYNNFGTKTGRLTVRSGGNILNLKRSYRNIFKSSFSEGKIFSIDFSSLEVRLLLLEAGKNISGDIYQKLSNIVNNKIPREVIKKIVISMIYGASKEFLERTLHEFIAISEAENFLFKLKQLFNIDDLVERLNDEVRIHGKITNRFGRCVKVDSDYDNGVLLNYYFQSSGADFCLITFADFIKYNNLKFKPLFVIHDSLVVDTPHTEVESLLSMSSIRSDFYNYNFPIKIEEFYNA